jgi:hypothetical protein
VARRVYLFFLLLLVAIVLAAWFLAPHSREGGAAGSAAQVVFDRYHYYEITPLGVDRVLLADRGWHYGTHEELLMPVFIQQAQGYREGISGLKAHRKNGELQMIGEVFYWHSDGYNLFTDRAVYNEQTEIVRGEGPFTFEWSGGRMEGRDFVANGPASRVKARDVEAVLYLNEIENN